MDELGNVSFTRMLHRFEMFGTRVIFFRDLPKCIEEYVDGCITLDYGCGPGTVTRLLKSTGLNVDGVDIDEEIINVAKQKDPLGNYAVITSGRIPSMDNHYDFIFSALVFSYVKTEEGILGILTEFNRCLKDSGIIIIIVPLANFYQCNYATITGLSKGCVLQSGTVASFKGDTFTVRNYYWSEETYRELITKAGFYILQVNYPLGLDTDGIAWQEEKDKPPCVWYIIRKTRSETTC